jgi:MFS family permease
LTLRQPPSDMIDSALKLTMLNEQNANLLDPPAGRSHHGGVTQTDSKTASLPRLPPLAPFRHRPFAAYWFARVFWTLGTQVQVTAMGWQVYDAARARGDSIAEGAFLLGLIGLMQFGPLLLLSLFGGQAADRFNRRLIIIVGLAIKALGAAVLVMLANAPPDTVILAIFALAALTGALSAFLPAASSAMVPNLLPREELPQAISLMSLAFQGATIIGPALGGVAYGVSAEVAYGLAAVMFCAALALVFLVKAPAQAAMAEAKTLALIAEGLRYVWSNKIVLGAISLDLGVVWFAGAMALLPVFARDVLHAGAFELGLLRSSMAVGAGLVALGLTIRPIERHVGYWMFAGSIVFALASIGFALSSVVWLSAVCLAIAGAGDMISVYVRASLTQLATPDAMRGRVSAVSFIFISASNELGDFQSGVAARIFGPVLAVAGGGVIAIGVALGWMKLFPELTKADRFSDAEVKEAA